MDSTDIGVDAVESAWEQMDDEDIADEIRETRERLKQVEDNPSEVLAVGVVVAYTDETTATTDDGSVADGMSMRIVNPTAHHGYRHIGSLLTDVEQFDAQLERLKVAADESEDVSLADLMGR